jgi:hypothetical protein
MSNSTYYEIRVEGELANNWSDWFEGLEIRAELNGEASLRGVLIDQAALFGVLNRIHSLNLVLISVQRHPE